MKSKIKPFIITLSIIGVFSCCTDKDLNVENEIAKQPTIETKASNPYFISKEEAIGELKLFLRNLNKEQSSRAQSSIGKKLSFLENLNLSDVETVQLNVKGIASRATRNDSLEDFFHLVNFDEGYAVLSADKRVPSVVLACAEEGNISTADFQAIDSVVTIEDVRKELPDFPGFHDKENDHYYVATSDSRQDVEREGTREIARLLKRSVDDYKDYKNYEDDGRGETGEGPRNYTEYTEWETVESVRAMLKTKWEQSESPYKDFSPKRRLAVVVGHQKKAPAGCVPLALAQILAYKKYPENFTYNGIKVDWNKLEPVYNNHSNEESRKMVAALIRGIGEHTIVWYTYYFAFGTPWKAEKFLRTIGYNNARVYRHAQAEKILTMLRNDKPVFLAGVSGVIDGHAWVIDGFKRNVREKLTKRSGTHEVVKREKEENLYVHCNWGWGGKCNGYYLWKVFDTRKGPEEIEPGVDWDNMQTDEYYFKRLFFTLTY